MGATIVTIDAEYAGQRVDNYLLRHLKGVAKSRIYRAIRSGEVRINSGRIKALYRLQAGDKLRVPPIRVAAEQEVQKPSQQLLELLEQSILFENEQVIVINKPSGLAVHGGSNCRVGLIEAVRIMRPEAVFLELAHRLDQPTSGCLLLAKTRPAMLDLHQLMREQKLHKVYLALVRGVWADGERIIEAPLLKNILQSGERMVKVSPEGKAARSIFRPLQIFKNMTLVEVTLITGRTHQIRVHAAHIGHPIAGDEKYGDPRFNLRCRSAGLSRLFLHASEVDTSSVGGVSLCAPLERSLLIFLQQQTF
jgi:23S rRNA pseudouridine955/2504/2580 synthase